MNQPTTRVAVLLGSLRAESVNRRVVEHLRSTAPAGVELEVVERLRDVPFYDEDADAGSPPATAAALRSAVGACDAVLVVTPEHNGSLPAVVKNGLDWLSRPFGEGAVKDKPLAVVGVSAGSFGGAWAHEAVHRVATVAGAHVPEDLTVSASGHGADPLADDDVARRFRGALSGLVDSAVPSQAA